MLKTVSTLILATVLWVKSLQNFTKVFLKRMTMTSMTLTTRAAVVLWWPLLASYSKTPKVLRSSGLQSDLPDHPNLLNKPKILTLNFDLHGCHDLPDTPDLHDLSNQIAIIILLYQLTAA